MNGGVIAAVGRCERRGKIELVAVVSDSKRGRWKR
jgi:hypothetical protein